MRVEPTMVASPADLPERSHVRVERLAAIGRLVLTGFTFVALSLDPINPTRYANLTYDLLIAYMVYAALFTVYTFRRTPGGRLGLVTHVLDLGLITVFVYLTEVMSSPFFAYFTFALVVATMRWQWRGALWTALFALLALNLLTAYAVGVLHDPTFELSRFIIRNLYLVVTGALLSYLGWFEQELRTELGRRVRTAAASDERVHLARDLHDGVLQTLTGTAFQLQTAERLVEREPAQARAVIGGLQQMILNEQRDLRFFIQELKPGPAAALDDRGALGPALHQLGQRLVSVWGVRLEVPQEPPPLADDGATAAEIYRIVQEAAVNAARHGQATEVTAEFGVADGQLTIAVTDNGHGFPFHGRLDHAGLAAARQGPRSLRERVTALGGTLDIESSRTGSRLHIRLPVAGEGA
jgi:signal transduction histidine kinase